MAKTTTAAKIKRIHQMVKWIGDYTMDNGYSPNLLDITREFNIAFSTASVWCDFARERKMLDWTDNVGRSFQVPGIYHVDDRSEKDG